MSSTVIFSVNENELDPVKKWNLTMIGDGWWDSLGDLFDEALLPKYLDIYNIIKSEEGQYLRFYSFAELTYDEFNLVINVMRDFISSLKEPTQIELNGIIAWNECVEPYLIMDPRYNRN